MNTIGTEGAHQIHREERKPAENESADDDAQCLGCLRFHSESFHLSFDIPFPHFHRPGLFLRTLTELSQRHLIPRLTFAATPPAGSPGAANPVDTAHLKMRVPGGGTQLTVRLPVTIVHGGLRTPRGRPLEGVTLCIQRLRARIRHRNLYLFPFYRATAIRLWTPRAPVVTPVVDTTSTTVNPQGQSLLVESRAKHFRALCRTKALINGFRSGDGCVVDPPVEKQHDQHWYIERAERAVNDVACVVCQFTDPGTRFHRDEYSGGVERSVLSERRVVRGVRPFVFPADQGWETDNEAQDPHGCH